MKRFVLTLGIFAALPVMAQQPDPEKQALAMTVQRQVAEIVDARTTAFALQARVAELEAKIAELEKKEPAAKP